MKREVKEISKQLANIPATKKGLIVVHPFISETLHNGEDVTANIEAFKSNVREIESKIDLCKTAKQVMELVNPDYRKFWFGMCRNYIGKNESSEIMGMIGITKPSWLKNANKEFLMTPNEYRTYDKLPEKVTLYGTRDGWYTTKRKAKSHLRIRRNQIYKIEVSRDKVLCYYNRRGEDMYVVADNGMTMIAA